MDSEEAPSAPPKSRQGNIKRNICIGILASTIATVLLIVILSVTVFKAKDPKIKLNSIGVRDLAVALNMARVRANLNVSLDVNIGIKNPNKFSFNLKTGNAEINYRSDTVGVVPVPPSKISADKTTFVNTTVTLLADRLLSNSQLYRDLVAGSLPMSSQANVSGKVSILGIEVSVSSTSACDFTVFIGNRTVSDQDCKIKSEL